MKKVNKIILCRINAAIMTMIMIAMLILVNAPEFIMVANAADHKTSIRMDAIDGQVNELDSLTLYSQLDEKDLKETDGYTVNWFYESITGDPVLIGTGVTYTFPICYGNIPVVYCEVSKDADVYISESVRPIINRDRDVASVVIKNKPVYAGTTVDGVTLSEDGQTLTLKNVNITEYVSGQWDPGCLFIDAQSDNFKIIIDGENTITITEDAYGVSGNFGANTDVSVVGGGTLNVITTAGAIYFAEMKNSTAKRHTKYTISDGITLNCKAINPEGTLEENYYNEAIEITGDVTFDNANVYAESDGRLSMGIFFIEKDGVAPANATFLNSNITCVNKCQTYESIDDGLLYASAFVSSSNEVIVDGTTFNATNTYQTAQESFAIRLLYADFIVSNGSVVNAECKYAEAPQDCEHSILLAPITVPTIYMDHATVNLTVAANQQAACYGLIYSKLIDIKGDSNLNIDSKGKEGETQGIKFYGSNLPEFDTDGIIIVNDSNVKINVEGEILIEEKDAVVGIAGRRFEANLSSEKYSIISNATNKGITGAYGIYMFDFAKSGQNNIMLSDTTKLTTPADSKIDKFDYVEGKIEGFSVFDSDDVSKPASQVVISGVTAPVTTHTVTAGVDGNGSITPSGANEVADGGTITFTAKADEGYELIGWNVNGTYVYSTETTYAVEAVDGDVAINAIFEKKAVNPVSPKTGDESAMGLYMIITILSLATFVLVGLGALKKKQL